MATKNNHSADDAALGFLYQGQYALLLLWRENDDDAMICLETLDDVVLVANGVSILEQLKHSLKDKPEPITLSSLKLWSTIKAWIDVLSEVELSRTWFHLVCVSGISEGSSLDVLLSDNSDRDGLLLKLTEEAERVKRERIDAATANQKTLPHAERAPACEAFLGLSEDLRAALLARVRIKPNQPNIAKIEDVFAESLGTVIREKRAQVGRQVIEWWNIQVLDLLSKKRKEGIRRFELLKRYMEIVSSIQLDELTSSFSTAMYPSSYQFDNMIERQISLVGGGDIELKRAVREEWRAREERSRWSRENPTWHQKIVDYDYRLVEEWSDRHADECKKCLEGSEDIVKKAGFNVLNWSHYEAHKDLEPIAPKITSPYYVRGAYQVLSIKGTVGWHPNYRKILGFK